MTAALALVVLVRVALTPSLPFRAALTPAALAPSVPVRGALAPDSSLVPNALLNASFNT